jgi:hypothetical protein
MTAARRGQKAAFLQSATSNVAKLPQWGPSAYLSHPSTILASAPDTRLHVEREGYSDKA